jgi:tripartite-type tricarboxylate transporter receptor subunit TctC
MTNRDLNSTHFGSRRIALKAVAAGVLAVCLAAPGATEAQTQEYPAKGRSIELLVGFGAGGGTDLTFRNAAKFLEPKLGVPVVVVNKPGAGGAVAWTELARTRGDGYKIGSVNLPAISGAHVTGALQAEPDKAFIYLGNIVFDPNMIAVKSDSKIRDLKDMVEQVRNSPNGASYAATGSVSTDGLTALALEGAANIKLRIVNFPGGKEAVTAILGGHVEYVGLTLSEALPYVKDGSIRILAVGGSARNPDVPNVATFAEQGYPLKINGASRGLVVPAGTDAAVVRRLRQAVREFASSSEYLTAAHSIGQMGVFVDGDTVQKNVGEEVVWLRTVLKK